MSLTTQSFIIHNLKKKKAKICTPLVKLIEWIRRCMCHPFNSSSVQFRFSELYAHHCVVNVSHISCAPLFFRELSSFSLSFHVCVCIMKKNKQINYATEKRQMHGKTFCCCHFCETLLVYAHLEI